MPRTKVNGVVSPPAGVTDGGASAIASAFDGVARGALQIGSRLREAEIEEGKQQAIIDNANVSRETSLSVTKREKRRFDFLRASDEAYENAANVLAIQRAEDAADAQLDKLELDHRVDPKAYQEGAEAWIKGYIGGDIPPDLAATVETSIRGKMKDGLHRVAKARQKLDIKETENGLNARIETITEKMDKFMRDNGLEGANDPAFIKLQNDLRAQYEIKAGNPHFAYSEDEMARDISKTTDALKKSAAFKAVADIYQAGGASEESRNQAFEAIETIVDTLGLTGDDAQTTRTALRKEVNAKHDLNEADIKAMDKEEKLRKEWAASHLKIGISRGELGAADIERYKSDLTPAKYAELTLQNDKAVKKRLDDRKAAVFTENLITGRTVANPFDTKHVKAISTYYDNVIAKDMANSDDPIGVAVSFVQQTGILPKGLEDGLVGTLLNGDPDKQIEAVGVMSGIARAEPIVYGQFPEKARRLASHANMLMEANMSPENAIIRAREAQFVDDHIRKSRKSQLSKKVMVKTVDAGLKDLKIDGIPDNERARTDYALLYEAEFLATGDEDAAHHITKSLMSAQWGETDVFGKDVAMKHPPEKIYGIAGLSAKQNARWIKEEFKKVLDANDPSQPGFNSKKFKPLHKRSSLVSDIQTTRVDGSYGVWHTGSDDKFPRPLMRDGLQVRFTPDWENSTERERRQISQFNDFERSRALHRNKLFGEPLPAGFHDERISNIGKNTL